MEGMNRRNFSSNNNNNNNNSSSSNEESDTEDWLKPPKDDESLPQGPVSFLVDTVSDFFGIPLNHHSKDERDSFGRGGGVAVGNDTLNLMTSPGEVLESMINGDGAKEIQSPWGNISVKRINEIVFLLGGASIISFALRTLFFGKTVRAIEIPDGNLSTIIIRSNTIKSLKKSILQNTDPIYPGVTLTPEDIKASAFVDPIFTEPILTNKHVGQIQDGAYIVWTKADYEIPRTTVALKSLIKDRHIFLKLRHQSELDKIIKLISLLGPSLTDKQIELNDLRRVSSPTSWQRLKMWWNSLGGNNQYHPDLPIHYQEIVMNDHTTPLTLKERDELIQLLLIGKGDPIFDLYRKHQFNIIEFKRQLKQWIYKYHHPTPPTTSTSNKK